MRELNEYIREKPRGFRARLVEKNNIDSSTMDNWQKKQYVVHEGVLYKPIRKIRGLDDVH